jgi:two-component system, sensor histidine kinase
VYLIALSGYARPEDVQKALTAGFDRHMSKPPALELLRQIVSSIA